MAETCRITGRRASSRSRHLLSLSLSLLALVATFAAPRVALGGGDCIDDEAARHRQAAMGAGAFVAAHRMVKAVVVYRMLVTDAERTHRVSPLAAKAMYRVGTGYQAMGLYEEAAEWYERFAAIHPREPDAVTALSDAVILRLALGDDAAATKDVAMAVERSGVATRGKTAALVFGLAAHQAERGQKEKARATLRGALGLLDLGPLDITIRSHALLATLAETPVVARAEHAKVRSAWANPAAAERTLRGGWPGESEGQLDHRVARVLNDVGAALFFAAEERRHAEVDSVKLPLHTGPFDQTALTAYASTTLRDWAAQRRAAIERLKSQYLRILDLEPWPSPRWVIAAGSAVGSMWGELADDLHRVAAAAAWKKDPMLYRSLMDALDAMGGPILAARAKSAMKKCIDLSVKYQFTDEHSRSCEAWLLVHDKTEFHAVEELIPPLRPPPGLPLPAPLLR